LAAQAERRGDRPEASSGKNGWGAGGQSPGLWSEASLSDLRLVRKAIRHNWPIPLDQRRRIIDEIFFPLRNGQTLPVRQILGRAWVVLEADKHDLRLLEAIRVLEGCLDTLTESQLEECSLALWERTSRAQMRSKAQKRH
jgi:hypothetical protein